MLKTKNIKSKWRSLLLAVTAVTSAAGPAASTFAWDASNNIAGERYTMGSPAKYGILNHITNNCSEDNYVDGDNTKECLGTGLHSELEFVRIRVASDSNALFEAYTGDTAVQLQAGQTYEVRAYYHNDAMSALGNLNANAAEYYIQNGSLPEGYTDLGECGGIGTIANTRLKLVIPNEVKAGQSDAQLGARYSYDSIHFDEATGKYQRDGEDKLVQTRDYVFDSLYLANSGDKDMRIVLDDATITLHNANATDGQKLAINAENDNDVFPDTEDGGALIGSLEMNGKVCACAEYSGYVSYTFHTEQAEADVVKEASLDGENFSNTVSANPGDIVTYRIQYKNAGTRDLTNVTFKDTLPTGVTLVPGTTKLVNYAHPDGIILDDVIGQNGINTGTYAPGATATITYQVKVNEDIYDQIDCTEVPLDNLIQVTDDITGTITSTSRILIKEVCTPSTPPTFPKTGPVEIATVVVAIAALSAGVIYYYNSQKALNAARRESGISGGKGKTEKSEAETKSEEKSEDKK